jgi:dihydroxyacetone kinase-like predicted kinase
VLDSELVAAEESVPLALLALLAKVAPENGALVTLYYGEGVTADEAGAMAREILLRFPEVEVEALSGGQPHYQYLVSVE